ncbi:MAG: type 1 glutamine amidotransferase [Deltaproteobacteria bacterium]|nr:type 1 glutamine amidotransferase [Deltaproteobacteria bacterium]
MANPVRFLIIDGYAKEGRDELIVNKAGCAGELYADMFRYNLPGCECDILFPSDPGATLEPGVSLEQYDGIGWTGCSLTVYDDKDERVTRQLELARQAYEKGVPSFGTCWGAQVAIVAAGGIVRANPRGREMGLARKIMLTPEGRAHPFYVGRSSVFDGFTSHLDEVTHLPPGALRLSTNAFTNVQSVAVDHKRGSFWALQYHPEYSLYNMARLVFCRIDKLITGGFFKTRDDALDYVAKLETLHAHPERKDLAWLLGIDQDILDQNVRQTEVKNWIERLVLPHIRR